MGFRLCISGIGALEQRNLRLAFPGQIADNQLVVGLLKQLRQAAAVQAVDGQLLAQAFTAL